LSQPRGPPHSQVQNLIRCQAPLDDAFGLKATARVYELAQVLPRILGERPARILEDLRGRGIEAAGMHPRLDDVLDEERRATVASQ
jgi:hypothetical protein